MKHAGENQEPMNELAKDVAGVKRAAIGLAAALALACVVLVVWLLAGQGGTDEEASSSVEEVAQSSQPVAAEVSSPPAETVTRADEILIQSERLGDSVMGPTLATPQSMAELFNKRGVPYPTDVYATAGAATIEDFCKLCVEEAEAEGVRAEVLFAQAMHETAWLQFGNQVSVEQNNFGGLGAVNSGGAGESFPDVRTGLRAQVQHLKAYASTENLKHETVDTRFDLVERGCAPRVQDLAGRWAVPGDGYAESIMTIVSDVYGLEGKSDGQAASSESE